MTRDDSAHLDPEVLKDPLDAAEEADPPEEKGVAAERALALNEPRALAPSDPFRRYLAELRKYPLLTREDEQALARRYRATGDRDALFRLVPRT